MRRGKTGGQKREVGEVFKGLWRGREDKGRRGRKNRRDKKELKGKREERRWRSKRDRSDWRKEEKRREGLKISTSDQNYCRSLFLFSLSRPEQRILTRDKTGFLFSTLSS